MQIPPLGPGQRQGLTVSPGAHQKNLVAQSSGDFLPQDSFQATNKALQLAYQTAIDNINKAVEETLGENALQRGLEEGMDISPEATAGRIVSGAMGMLPAYREQHPELSSEESLSSFKEIIMGGVKQGFDEARDILKSLAVLQGEIAENIDKTFDLVESGIGEYGLPVDGAFVQDSRTDS